MNTFHRVRAFTALAAFSLISINAARAADPSNNEAGVATPQCAPPPIAIVDKVYKSGWNDNPELVANVFSLYAAASYDTYEPRDGDSRAFRVADNHPDLLGTTGYGTTGWNRVARHQNKSGLLYDVYYRDLPGQLNVMVAYRGTDGLIDMDAIANASWLTQWINPWDQYRQARNEFIEVREAALKTAAGRKISFVATGHSLGGGLAQHVAHVHPCVSAVVFNSSPVTNTAIYGRHTPRLIKIYEDGDGFEQLEKKIVNTEALAIYRLKLENKDGVLYNHNMERLAANSSRMAIDCLKSTPGCEIKDGASMAKTLYCSRYFGFRWKADVNFRNSTNDSKICPRPTMQN